MIISIIIISIALIWLLYETGWLRKNLLISSPKPATVSENPQDCETTKIKVPRREIVVGIAAIVFTIVLMVVTILYKDQLMSKASTIGYSLLGMLVVSFLAGSILSFTAIPVPYWLLVFSLPSVLAVRWGLLAPVVVGLTSALGATLGHMPTFYLGYGGRTLSQKVTARFNNRLYKRVVGWSQKHGWIGVFLTSATPNPVHLPLTIAFGTLRYSPWKFFVYSLLGNIVKSGVLAFAGYYGLTSLLKLLGV